MRRIRAIRHKHSWSHKGAKHGVAKARKSSWSTKDRGKRYHTPKGKRWSHDIDGKPSHKIVDYSIDLPRDKRKAILNKEVKQRANYGAARFKSLGKMKEGALSTKRTLQRVININPSRRSDKVMKKDLRFIENRYKV